jgi:hypothetical protein
MKYTRELLDTLLKEGDATLLGEYSNYNQRMYVRFRCKCGTEYEKRFEMLNKYKLAYCKECSIKKNNEKYKETCMKRFGVSNVSKLPEIMDKIKNVFEEKYGGHPKRTKEVQKKWVNTCLEKYGGHPNQNPGVQAKAEHTSFQHRDYTMPSGKIVKIQGYEDKALDELLECFVEEDIIVGRGNVPTIHYTCKEGTERVYFPDFHILSMNTILEIKSEWTLTLKTCRLDEKAEAVKEARYNYEVWVYDGSKENKRTLTF